MADVLWVNDPVNVWPVGRPEERAAGKIGIASTNQRSCAVFLDDKPPWFTIQEGAFFCNQGLVMLLYRERAEGPWSDVIGNAKYEVQRAGEL